jgi:CheY-like chemotaxis protein
VFSVLLPAAAPDAPAEPVKAPRAAAASGLRARVLVVDDDAMVAKTIGRVLRDHDVTVVTNGRDALDLLLTEKTFDVILCDLMMPVMTGMDLHRALGEKRPELAAIMIFVTGGAFTDETRDFLDHVPNERIEKPFDPRTLRAVVERAARPAP